MCDKKTGEFSGTKAAHLDEQRIAEAVGYIAAYFIT